MVMFWGSLFTVSSWMVTLQWSCQICINNAQIQKQGTVNVFFAMHSHAVIPSFAWKKFFPSALLKLISFSLLSLTKFITRNGSLEFKVLSMWMYILSLWKSGQMSLQLVLWENFSCQRCLCSDVRSHNLPTFMLPYFALPLEEIFDHWSQYVLVSKETRKWKCC